MIRSGRYGTYKGKEYKIDYDMERRGITFKIEVSRIHE